MKGDGVDSGEMTVIVSNDFIRFEIPALDHLAWSTWS